MSFNVKANSTIHSIDEYTALYNGSSNGNITLSDSVSNYKYVDIMYRVDNSYSSVRIWDPNNKSVALHIYDYNESLYWYSKTITMSQKAITVNRYREYKVQDSISWLPHGSGDNSIYITKVIGYN